MIYLGWSEHQSMSNLQCVSPYLLILTPKKGLLSSKCLCAQDFQIVQQYMVNCLLAIGSKFVQRDCPLFLSAWNADTEIVPMLGLLDLFFNLGIRNTRVPTWGCLKIEQPIPHGLPSPHWNSNELVVNHHIIVCHMCAFPIHFAGAFPTAGKRNQTSL